MNDCSSLTVDELKSQLGVAHVNNKGKSSRDGKKLRTMFQGGLSGGLEIKTLEAELQRAQQQSGWDWKEDERYDFCFYTPSCQQVRVKVRFLKNNKSLSFKRTKFVLFVCTLGFKYTEARILA